MTHSKVRQSTRTLRLHLLDMCRLSQRCVDYSIKALQLGRLDISSNIFDGAQEIDNLHHQAGEIAQELLLKGLLSQLNLRFVSASIRICDVLQVIHRSALEIAEAGLLHQEENCVSVTCADLATMGDLANRLMRLCTVALFKEEVGHAETALQMKTGQSLAVTTYAWYRRISLRSPSRAHFIQSMTDRLDQLIWQMHEMARAIIYWLGDRDRASLLKPTIISQVLSTE